MEDIVRTDIMRTHVDNLLSFTLKSGCGGAPVGIPAVQVQETKEDRVGMNPTKSVEELERALESNHQVYREETKKKYDADAKAKEDRVLAREASQEHIRKFKQESRNRHKVSEGHDIVVAFREPAGDVVRAPSQFPQERQQAQVLAPPPKVKSLAELRLERDGQNGSAALQQQSHSVMQHNSQQRQQNSKNNQPQQSPWSQQQQHGRQDQHQVVRQVPTYQTPSGGAEDYESIARR